MRAIVLAALAVTGLCIAADPALKPAPLIKPGVRPPNALERPTREITPIPPLQVATANAVAGTEPSPNLPKAASESVMAQTFKSAEGCSLTAATLQDPLTASAVFVRHVVVNPSTKYVFSGSGDFHTLEYAKGPADDILLVGNFQGIADGKHEYELVLTAKHLDGDLKNQITLRIGSTAVPPQNITPLSSESISVRFTYDPTGSTRGNVLPFWVNFATAQGESQYTNHTMYFKKMQLMMK